MPSSGGIIYLPKWTSYSSGVPFTLAGSPVVSIYKDNDTTQSIAGVTLIVNFDSVTGLNHISIDTSADATFYANGHSFSAVITTGTVNSVSVVGQVVGSFDLAAALGPVAGGVTLADGVAHGGATALLRLGSSTSTAAFYVTNSGGDATKFESTGSNGNGQALIGSGSGSGFMSAGGSTSGYGMTIFGGPGGNGIYLSGGSAAGGRRAGSAMIISGGSADVGGGEIAASAIAIYGGDGAATDNPGALAIEIYSGFDNGAGAADAIHVTSHGGHGISVLAAGTDKKALLLAGDAATDSLAIAAGSNPPVNIFSALGGVTLADGVTHGGNAAILSLAQITVTAAAASDNAAFILRGDGSGAGFDVKGGTTGAGFDIQGGGISGNAISVTGIHGHGIRVLGGSTGSWNGITVASGSSTNSAAMTVTGNGSGSGLILQGGATGDALDLFGGSTSGFSIFAQSHGTDCARWVVQSGNGDAFSGIGHGTGVGFRSSAAAVGFGSGTVDANIVSSAINVPCILADGVTHGGTTALLRLGSSTSTAAFYVTNSGGDATKFQSTGGDGNGLAAIANGGGGGFMGQGGNGGGSGLFAFGGTGGSGIGAFGDGNQPGFDCEGGSSAGQGILAIAGPGGIGFDSRGGGGGTRFLSTGSGPGFYVSSSTTTPGIPAIRFASVNGPGLEIVVSPSFGGIGGHGISVLAAGADKKAVLLASDAMIDSFAIAAGLGTPIGVFDAEGNVKIKIPGI